MKRSETAEVSDGEPRVVADSRILILHNIRSSHNVGSLFRTADGAGVDFVYLVGYTPAPVDEFGRENKEIAKTALGAEKSVPWKKVSAIGALIKKLQEEKISVIALEQTATSKNLFEFAPPTQWALVVGNEVKGVDKKTCALCDTALEIPMRGKKESLNVAVAAGVALYYLLARRENVPM